MELLTECGVSYRHLSEGEVHHPHEGGTEFTYHWLHVPTRKAGTRRMVVLGGERGFFALLRYWNHHPDWCYYP